MRLPVKGVAPAMVGMVADVTRIVGIHETERAIVESQTEDGHVVGVHHPMREADRLPFGHQPGGARDHFVQKTRIFVRRIGQLGKMPGDHVIGKQRNRLGLVPVEKHLERAEAHVRRRHARHHRGAFDALAPNLFVAADDAQGARGGNAQAMHGLRAQVFADAGTQHGAAIAAARKRRGPGPLELKIPVLPGAILHFAQQYRAAIAQLRHEMAELVPGIEHRQRVAAGQQTVADEILGKVGAHRFVRIQIDQFCRIRR